MFMVMVLVEAATSKLETLYEGGPKVVEALFDVPTPSLGMPSQFTSIFWFIFSS